MLEHEPVDKFKGIFPVLSQTIDVIASYLTVREEFAKTGLPDIFEYRYGHPPNEEELAEWRSRPIGAIRFDIIDFFYNEATIHLKGHLESQNYQASLMQRTVEYDRAHWEADRETLIRQDGEVLGRISQKLFDLQKEHREFKAKRGVQLPFF